MPTKIEIANQAILNVGGRPIDSLAQKNETAEIVNSVIDSVIESVAILHPWRDIVHTSQLPTISTSEVLFQYTKRYSLPDRALKLWELFDANGYTITDYRRQGKQIATHEYDKVFALYTVNDFSVEDLSPHVVGLIYRHLSEQIAIPISGSENRRSINRRAYEDWIRRAKSIDSQGGPVQDLRPDADSPVLGAMENGLSQPERPFRWGLNDTSSPYNP